MKIGTHAYASRLRKLLKLS